jgi:hypothetical protein
VSVNKEKELKLRRMAMKKLIAALIPGLMLFTGAFTQSSDELLAQEPSNTSVNVGNDISTTQNQSVSLVGGGDSDSSSSSDSKSSSNAKSSIVSNSVSNFETRTPPITTFPPYLPYWTHGGWGTIKAYFPNGPNNDDQVYERVFNPQNPNDIRELKSVLESLPYENPLGMLAGILNGVGAAFGGPDNYHHGRGFEIASSLVRTRRPKGKPLLVFIDSNVDTGLLKEAGYAYVGKVSLEGKVDRNWDHVYDAAVAEALPWDVDILLISGGMKGVTVGSNIAFPGAGGAYSQANYSVSMFGAVSSGITEGKGKAVISAAAYRYWPTAAYRRTIPKAFYERIQASIRPAKQTEQLARRTPPEDKVQRYLPPSQQPSVTIQQQYPEAEELPSQAPQKDAPAEQAPDQCDPAAKQKQAAAQKKMCPGIKVSQELLEMAGLGEHQHIQNLTVK